jgi:CBS domain-containing protein
MVTARDLMRKDMVVVTSAAPLSEVERVLAENRISGAPVVDEAGAIVGVISIRDLVQRYAEEPDGRPRRERAFYGLESDDRIEEDLESFEIPEDAEDTAADVMTTDLVSVPADAGLGDVAKAMTTHKVHRLLVEDGGRYVGLVSTLEILDALGA